MIPRNAQAGQFVSRWLRTYPGCGQRYIRSQSRSCKSCKGDCQECITLTNKLNLGLSESELMEQIIRASEQMDGQMVSTLQDISTGKQTKRDTLNLEIAYVANSMQPQIDIPETELLGKMIVAKSNVTSFSEETQQLLKIEHPKFKGETSCLNQ